MDWEEYSQVSMAFGKGAAYVVSMVLIYIFSFVWITHPIFLALFTKTLDMRGSENEVVGAVCLWIAIFVLHCAAFAYCTGLIAKNRERVAKFAKEIWENEWKRGSRTD